jgi:hypothetical protein
MAPPSIVGCVVLGLLPAAFVPGSALAQRASPYLPVSHWATPHLEALIAGGVIRDPFPIDQLPTTPTCTPAWWSVPSAWHSPETPRSPRAWRLGNLCTSRTGTPQRRRARSASELNRCVNADQTATLRFDNTN